MRNRITPRNRSLYGFVGKLYVLAFSHWRVSGVDGRNRLELHFLESALPENSDWISCSGCENSRSSGEKPNFDPTPQTTRNDSSYQFIFHNFNFHDSFVLASKTMFGIILHISPVQE